MRQRGGKSGGKCPRSTGGKSGGKRPSLTGAGSALVPAATLTKFLVANKPGGLSSDDDEAPISPSSETRRVDVQQMFADIVTNDPDDSDDAGEAVQQERERPSVIHHQVETMTTTTTLSQELRTSCHQVHQVAEARVRTGPAVMRTKRAKQAASGKPEPMPMPVSCVQDDGSGRPIAQFPWERCKQCSDASNRSLQHCFKNGHMQRDASITYDEAMRLRAERQPHRHPGQSGKATKTTPTSTSPPTGSLVARKATATAGSSVSAKRQRTVSLTTTATAERVLAPVPMSSAALVAADVQPVVRVPIPATEEVSEERRMQQAVTGLLLALQTLAACWPLNTESALPIGVELLRAVINYQTRTGAGAARPDTVAQLLSVLAQLLSGMSADHRLQAAAALGSTLCELGPDAGIAGLLRVVQVCGDSWDTDDKARLLAILHQQLAPPSCDLGGPK